MKTEPEGRARAVGRTALRPALGMKFYSIRFQQQVTGAHGRWEDNGQSGIAVQIGAFCESVCHRRGGPVGANNRLETGCRRLVAGDIAAVAGVGAAGRAGTTERDRYY